MKDRYVNTWQISGLAGGHRGLAVSFCSSDVYPPRNPVISSKSCKAKARSQVGPRRRPAVNFLDREGGGPQSKDPLLCLSQIFILVGLPPSLLFTLTSLLRRHPFALCLLSSPSLASQYNSNIKPCVAVTTALTEPHPDLPPRRLPFRPASLIGWFGRWTRWLPPPAAQRGYLADEYE